MSYSLRAILVALSASLAFFFVWHIAETITMMRIEQLRIAEIDLTPFQREWLLIVGIFKTNWYWIVPNFFIVGLMTIFINDNLGKKRKK